LFFCWAAPNWNLSWFSSKEDWKGVLLNLHLFRVVLKNNYSQWKIDKFWQLGGKKRELQKVLRVFPWRKWSPSHHNMREKKSFSWRKWSPSHHIMREKNGVLGENEAQVDWHVVRFGSLMWWIVTIPPTWKNWKKKKNKNVWLWT
jgi:hypothetical protein